MGIEQSAARSQWQTPTVRYIDGMVDSESGASMARNECTCSVGYSPSGTFGPTS